MTNYIVDGNPLNLAGPPAWWLKKLHDFDPDLVVVPSRMGYFYRLAQRRPPDAKTHLVHHLQGDNDSNMLRRNNLVPVTTIIATCRWDNPLMWEDLRQRMPSRMGGAEKFEQALIAKENEKELRERADRDDMLTQVAKASKNWYDVKRGVRSNLWIPATKEVAEKPTFGSGPAIKIASKYETLEKHIKKPFSQK